MHKLFTTSILIGIYLLGFSLNAVDTRNTTQLFKEWNAEYKNDLDKCLRSFNKFFQGRFEATLSDSCFIISDKENYRKKWLYCPPISHLGFLPFEDLEGKSLTTSFSWSGGKVELNFKLAWVHLSHEFIVSPINFTFRDNEGEELIKIQFENVCGIDKWYEINFPNGISTKYTYIFVAYEKEQVILDSTYSDYHQRYETFKPLLVKLYRLIDAMDIEGIGSFIRENKVKELTKLLVTPQL